MNILLEHAIEFGVILIGLGILKIGSVIKPYLDNLKEKDKLQIIDHLTDRAVEYAEVKYSGKPGEEKLSLAVQKSSQWLYDRGIQVPHAELISGIENGVNKLKMNQIAEKSMLLVQEDVEN